MAVGRRSAVERTATILAFMVAIAAVAAAYSYFSYTNPGGPASVNSSTTVSLPSSITDSTCSVNPGEAGHATVTQTVGGWPGCGCMLVASNSDGTLYVTTNAVVGDNVCLAASLYYSDSVGFTITNSTGSVVLETAACVSSGGLDSSSSTGVSCESDWNTAAPGESGGVAKVGTGAVTAGIYTLAATGNTGSPVILEANFTLG